MAKIIGHRGAAGLALENTLESIRIAREYGVDAIEFDIRRTKDNEVVLCHDSHLARVSIADTVLAEINLEDLMGVKLHNNATVPHLKEALIACGDTPVIIEIKDSGMSHLVLNIIEAFPEKRITITSFIREEIKAVRDARPDLPVFIAEHFNPIEIIAIARNLHTNGITLNAWLMNPLTYILARRYKLSLLIYTVNNAFIARFLRILYPEIMICTDRPDKFKRRRLWKTKKRLQKAQARIDNAPARLK